FLCAWIIFIGNAMRDELALQAHIVLNEIGVSEQTMAKSTLIQRYKMSNEVFIFLQFFVTPIIAGNFHVWHLRKCNFSSKANRADFETTLVRQSGRGKGTLETGKIAFPEKDLPGTAILRIVAVSFLFCIVEEPKHASFW